MNVEFQLPGINKDPIHWARIVIAVALCAGMYYTDAIPVYNPNEVVPVSQKTEVAEAKNPIYYTNDLDQDDEKENVDTLQFAVQDVEEEDDDFDDDDDEFTGDAYYNVKKAHDLAEAEKKKKNSTPQGPPKLSFLFVMLFSLFEPIPQLALLTLTNSGTSSYLSIVASLVQPEVAALYFAIMRGYYQHHIILFIGYIIVFVSNAVFGNLYNVAILLMKLFLSEERWKATIEYAHEVQGKIDESYSKNDKNNNNENNNHEKYD